MLEEIPQARREARDRADLLIEEQHADRYVPEELAAIGCTGGPRSHESSSTLPTSWRKTPAIMRLRSSRG